MLGRWAMCTDDLVQNLKACGAPAMRSTGAELAGVAGHASYGQLAEELSAVRHLTGSGTGDWRTVFVSGSTTLMIELSPGAPHQT